VTLTVTGTITSTTKIESKNGKPLVVSDIAVGDSVTMKGGMVSGNSFVFNATVIRNISKVFTPIVTDTRQVFEGTVQVLPGAVLPTTVTILIGSTPQVVNVTQSATVLNTAWSPIALSLFQSGDAVRVFGYIPAGSTSVTGLVIRNISR
jgi:hypothetical protein